MNQLLGAGSRRRLCAVVALLGLALTGCGSSSEPKQAPTDSPVPSLAPPPPPPPTDAVPKDGPVLATASAHREESLRSVRSVRVFFGTNRARGRECATVQDEIFWDDDGPCLPPIFFTGLPADIAAGDRREGLEVGMLSVSFPPGHEAGQIERPTRILSISLTQEDPEEHVVLTELRSYGADYPAWAARVRSLGRKQAFIYVHGFETSFHQAALRAAQIAFDLDFDLDQGFAGVPMFFSWPSRGGVTSYGVDYDTSFESIGAFNSFLDLVRRDAGIEHLHVIAHSMGNRVVAEALLDRSARADTPERVVDQLILAAPDIWASRFKNRLLRVLPGLASRVTLYVSDQDRALVASSSIRQDEARAGQVAGGLLEASREVEGFDAIDASSLSSDFLGHSYYANTPSMLSDIHCLLQGVPSRQRPLLEPSDLALRFKPWEKLALLPPGLCFAAAPPPAESWWRPALIGVAGILLIAAAWAFKARSGRGAPT